MALPRISRPRRTAARRIDTIDAQPLARSGPLPQGEEAAPALDVVHDISIMAAISAFAGVPLFIFIDDFATFFYHFRLASRCLCYCGIVMLESLTRSCGGCGTSSRRLAMGLLPSSNIAQMGGEAFLYLEVHL